MAMKKTNFKQLAVLGIAGGMLLASQSQVNAESNSEVVLAGQNGCGANSCSHKSQHVQPNNMLSDSNKELMQDMSRKTPSQKIISEGEFRSQLDDKGKRIYSTLDPEGKELALKLANQQGAEKNANDAVRDAAKQMAERRDQNNKS